MDLIQNGESSRSPSRHLSTATPLANGDISRGDGRGEATSLADRMSRLIMPAWQATPPKHVHASHNFIELLSLQSQYEDYVRPYVVPVTEEDGDVRGSGKARKADVRKFERGYAGLLDDCIDPIPNVHNDMKNGDKDILALISDIHGSGDPLGRVMPDVWDQPIEMLSSEAFKAATLAPGSTQNGYKDGRKISVIEAEERKERKRQRQLRLQSQQIGGSPAQSPTLAPHASSPITTPLLPVEPPSRAGSRGTFANMQAQAQAGSLAKNGLHKSTSGGIRLSIPGQAARSPANLSSPVGGLNNKRPNPDGAMPGKTKKVKTAGTRSASPMPARPPGPEGGYPLSQSGQQGYGKGPRARTEG